MCCVSQIEPASPFIQDDTYLVDGKLEVHLHPKWWFEVFDLISGVVYSGTLLKAPTKYQQLELMDKNGRQRKLPIGGPTDRKIKAAVTGCLNFENKPPLNSQEKTP